MTSAPFALEPARRAPGPQDLFILLRGDRLVWRADALEPFWPASKVDPAYWPQAVAVGRWREQALYVLNWPADQELPQALSISLRRWLPDADPLHWQAVGAAVQRLHWQRDHAWCGRCGGATQPHPHEYALYCAACDHRWFPRIAPCVIVAIERPGDILLARAHHYPLGFYSLIAGFVEPGESVEQAVVREVFEETGLQVVDLTYQGSEPWPFPHQLMLGFRARALPGELRVQADELAELAWFPQQALPNVPGPYAIAGRLIRRVCEASA
ncbi:MAG: NAD(+) diphosphatase [Gammaproteobacteria bacterium]|nr:NAD(+) diphosphatase [Gammaproteobacteria bacterium]